MISLKSLVLAHLQKANIDPATTNKTNVSDAGESEYYVEMRSHAVVLHGCDDNTLVTKSQTPAVTIKRDADFGNPLPVHDHPTGVDSLLQHSPSLSVVSNAHNPVHKEVQCQRLVEEMYQENTDEVPEVAPVQH